MKSYSHIRKSAGAVLGLVVSSILIVIAIGVFMYFIGALIGGNGQLNRASDAGILAVAKQAVIQPAVALNDPSLVNQGLFPYNDFAFLSNTKDNNGSPTIDLITYNRCAAQALLVSHNAELININNGDQPLARQHAQQVCLAVLGIGKALTDKFESGSLNSVYDNFASLNNLNFLGSGSTLSRLGDIKPAFVGHGPANVYFYGDTVALGVADALSWIPQNTAATDVMPDQAKAVAGDPYLLQTGKPAYYPTGYQPILVMPGTAEASLVGFIPNLPTGGSPGEGITHLIDQKRAFAAVLDSRLVNMNQTQLDNALVGNGPPGANVPNGLFWIPPNAFIAQSQANVDISSNQVSSSSTNTKLTGIGPGSGNGNANSSYVNAISCAIVGVGGQDFAAAIPGGFVRICNLPDMVQCGNLPLGPVPAPGENNTVDGSNVILNNEGLGAGSEGNLTITVGTPIPINPDGSLGNVVFACDAFTKNVLQFWVNFNNSRLNPSDPNYNTDVVTVNGVTQHRNPALDGYGPQFGYSANSAQLLAAGQNPSNGIDLLAGTTPNQIATLRDVIPITGTVTVSSATFNGIDNVLSSDGITIDSTTQGKILFDVVGTNLGRGLPSREIVPVPTDHKFWTFVEYLKYKVMEIFNTYYHQGHYTIPALSKALLTSGFKHFSWFVKGTNQQVHITSPNNQGSGIPSSAQFMSIGTPTDYLNDIDNVIQTKGGYKSGQLTEQDTYQALTDMLRLVNAKWTIADVKTALASAPLPPGQTMYLRDDGNGNLVLASTCPQDTGIPTDNGVPTFFGTQAGQYLDLNDYVVNASKDGTSSAIEGDCNVEAQPYRTITPADGVMPQASLVAQLDCSTGYNNLLGSVKFYMQPAHDVSSLNLANMN